MKLFFWRGGSTTYPFLEGREYYIPDKIRYFGKSLFFFSQRENCHEASTSRVPFLIGVWVSPCSRSLGSLILHSYLLGALSGPSQSGREVMLEISCKPCADHPFWLGSLLSYQTRQGWGECCGQLRSHYGRNPQVTAHRPLCAVRSREAYSLLIEYLRTRTQAMHW